MEDKELNTLERNREIAKAILAIIKTPEDLIILRQLAGQMFSDFMEFYEKHNHSNN